MTRRARILFVDDDQRFCRTTKRWLEKHDFTVFTASTIEEAQEIGDREFLHLALIDIVLSSDPEDRSGFGLAKKMWRGIRKLFLTVLDNSEDVLEGLSDEMREEANVIGYVRKIDGEQKLLEAILKGLRPIHLDLDIRWGEYSPRELIEKLKSYKRKDEEEKRAGADELDDLFCKLFDHAKSIEVVELKRGKGGCAVVRLQPTMPQGKGTDVMVKFGPRETIIKEWENYTTYVDNFLPHGRTVISGEPAQTLHLAAIKYSFVGGSGIDGAFKDYFSRATPESIQQLLNYLFKETCAQWYENKRPPKGDDETLPLDVLYKRKDSLNLSDSKHLEELEAIIEQLLTREDNPYASNIKKSGETNLQVSLGPYTEVLPNPLYVTMRERLGGEAAANLFPIPSLMSTTHGDLNGNNIIVGKNNITFLIDFYKTGISPIFRDFVVLESIIKFELLETKNLIQRYALETALLQPLTFSDAIPLRGMDQDQELGKVLTTIQKLRHLAYGASLLDNMYEYYVGLLFYALRDIVGFSSAPDKPSCCHINQYHALLSAAKICQKLLSMKAQGGDMKRDIRIFLSHASEDKAEVSSIYRRLALEGFAPWIAPDDIFAGETWSRSIERAIQEADFFIPVLTKNSVDKRGFRQRENKQALDIWLEKMARDIYIIPARLDDCGIPEELDKFQCVDLYKEGGWERLISAIREGIRRSEKPDSN